MSKFKPSFYGGRPVLTQQTVFGTPRVVELGRRAKQAILAQLPPGCAHCGAEGEGTVDHRLARVFGGSNQLPNLQRLCGGCNQKKADRESRIADIVRRLLAERQIQRPVVVATTSMAALFELATQKKNKK